MRQSQRPEGRLNRDDLDPMAERFAVEHKRFLEQHPSVLSQQSDPTGYLSSVGQTVARTGLRA